MARPNSGEFSSPNLPTPYQPPAGGPPMPVPPAGPYGPGAGFAGPTPPAKAGPTPLGLLHALKRRWVLASFLGLLTAAAVAAGVWVVMPAGRHTARTLIQLKVPGQDIGGKTSDDFANYRLDQLVLLKTRDLHNRVASEPAVASLDTVRDAEDPAHVIEEAIKVDLASPYIISVTMTGNNPGDMKTILDMLGKKYADDANDFERKARTDKMKKIEALIERLQGDIRSQTNKINLMAQANSTTGGKDAEARLAEMQQTLAQLNAQVFATQKEVDETEVNIALFEKKIKDKRFGLDPLVLLAKVNEHPRVAVLVEQKRRQEFLLQRDLEIGQFKPGDAEPPTIKNLRSSIEQLTTQIAAAQKAVEPEIKVDLERWNEQNLKAQLGDLQDKVVQLKALLAYRKQFRDNYQTGITSVTTGTFSITTQLKELEPQKEFLNQLEHERLKLVTQKELDARVQIREPATVSINHNLNKKVMLSAGGGAGSFFLVLALIGFLEWRTRRVDGVDQVVTDLGMRVIGTVPAFPNKASLKAADAAGNANWRFVLNESINSTRTMLLHSARKEAMQVVMVTSATQGEGKTSLASQLGTSMAAAGMRTLIVDCDLRNPSIHKLFDLGLSVGVSEVLCAEADVSDAVQPTAVPNLWVIPAGQCSTRVITALAQGHPLETLFNRLRGQFDFIIVDSCPVLPVADALLIGQHVDGVVFSIMQDISQLPKIQVASEKLQLLNVPLLGAVVNNVSAGSAYYAYGYNYVKQLPA